MIKFLEDVLSKHKINYTVIMKTKTPPLNLNNDSDDNNNNNNNNFIERWKKLALTLDFKFFQFHHNVEELSRESTLMKCLEPLTSILALFISNDFSISGNNMRRQIMLILHHLSIWVSDRSITDNIMNNETKSIKEAYYPMKYAGYDILLIDGFNCFINDTINNLKIPNKCTLIYDDYNINRKIQDNNCIKENLDFIIQKEELLYLDDLTHMKEHLLHPFLGGSCLLFNQGNNHNTILFSSGSF